MVEQYFGALLHHPARRSTKVGLEGQSDFRISSPSIISASVSICWIHISNIIVIEDPSERKINLSATRFYHLFIPDNSPQIETNQLEDIRDQTEEDISVKQISLKRFPASIQNAIKFKQRPTPSERREFVRHLCDEIIAVHPKPLKKDLEPIDENVVSRYPETFQDEFNRIKIGKGYSSLLNQMISNCENLRWPKTDSKKYVQDKKLRIKSHQAYACKNFLPDFPENETPESLKEKKMWLTNEFMKVEQNHELIYLKMRETFAMQRLDIANLISFYKVIESWPFLNLPKYMLLHFKLLTNIDFEERIKSTSIEKISELIKFWEDIPKMKQILNEEENPLKILKLLCYYFEENESVLFKIYEECTPVQTIVNECPVTPFIAVFGDPVNENALVIIEKKPLISTLNLSDAFCVFNIIFYVMGMKYPTECPATMEFLQRILLNIDYEGSKVAKKAKRSNINVKALKLLNKLQNFRSLWKI